MPKGSKRFLPTGKPELLCTSQVKSQNQSQSKNLSNRRDKSFANEVTHPLACGRPRSDPDDEGRQHVQPRVDEGGQDGDGVAGEGCDTFRCEEEEVDGDVDCALKSQTRKVSARRCASRPLSRSGQIHLTRVLEGTGGGLVGRLETTYGLDPTHRPSASVHLPSPGPGPLLLRPADAPPPRAFRSRANDWVVVQEFRSLLGASAVRVS